MPNFSILIHGLVQGVGFRPLVRQMALGQGLAGWVKNIPEGVEIRLRCTRAEAEHFLEELLLHPPANAIIRDSRLTELNSENHCEFPANEIPTGFSENKSPACFHKNEIPAGFPENKSPADFLIVETIVASSANEDLKNKKAATILAPDTRICSDCRREISDKGNRRYRYPFTTCLNCGPRSSIIRALPYDRPNTTMAHLAMCPSCAKEYSETGSRREHSQTNSCPDCAIPVHYYDRSCQEVSRNWKEIVGLLTEALRGGKIVAVKGIGGYHLLADATREQTVILLRERKGRPQKPFAILYNSIDDACRDVAISKEEEVALLSPLAPVVLCKLKTSPAGEACTSLIAPGLDRLGVLLPYTPLLHVISESVGRPLVATSANISGAPMIYRDDEALKILPKLADFILTVDREITMPLDDSVVVFNEHGERIILRRGRGFVLQENPLTGSEDQQAVLAAGAELKGSFLIANREQTLLSPYLGNQQSLDARQSYDHTLKHLQGLYNFKPDIMLADAHPDYRISYSVEEWANKGNLPLHRIQHHRAHFAAILAEHGQLRSPSPALGFIWDGSGYGDDGHIWGGEVLLKTENELRRIHHLDYFPVIAGDKMSREPRLAALSLLHALPQHRYRLRPLFTPIEWDFYQKVLQAKMPVYSSSMGRLLDTVACLLGICTHNSYEGEAAMKLQALAGKATGPPIARYGFPVEGPLIRWQPFLQSLIQDLEKNIEPEVIALNTLASLAALIAGIARMNEVSCLAFSGGVFQNSLLTDLLMDTFKDVDEHTLCFHRNISPNDENIAYGQYAYYCLTKCDAAIAFSKKEDVLCA